MIRPPANVEHLLWSAASLVRAAAPYDWPAGFVVIPDRLPWRVTALACGTGEALAAVYGARPGVAGVLLDPWKCIARLDDPTLAEIAFVECAAVHEAGHVLTSTESTPERVAKVLEGVADSVPAYRPERVARHHCPRWAMAYWLLVTRAAAFRPRTGAAMVDHAAAELAVYGYPRADLEQLALGAPTDEPLAPRLVAGGAWEALLVARLPDESTRTSTIAAAGVFPSGKEG